MQLPQNPLDALDAILSEAACTPMDVAEFTANGQSCRFAISCGIGLTLLYVMKSTALL